MVANWLQSVAHILAILLLATWQITFALPLDIWQPDLVLAIVIALSLSGDERHTFWWVTGGGLILGLAVPDWFGVHIFINLAIALVLLTLHLRWLGRPPVPVAIPIAWLAALASQLMWSLLVGGLAWAILLPVTVTAFTAVLLYQVLLKIGRQREVIRLD